MRELTHATLRITDAHYGKEEDHVVKNQAFQLTYEEARAAMDLVTSMSSIYFFVFVFILMFCDDVIRDIRSQWYACSCPYLFGCYSIIWVSRP